MADQLENKIYFENLLRNKKFHNNKNCSDTILLLILNTTEQISIKY